MYQLVSAIVKPVTGDGRWVELDIGNVPLYQLFSNFKKVIAILSNPYLTANVAFDIESVIATEGASRSTFTMFLAANGNATLETSNTLPVINTRYAKYADAFHAGYAIEATHPTADPTAQMPDADKTNIMLTKAGVDYDLFYKSCLMNVNGFYHKTDASTAGVYVVDGMKSVHKCHRNELGIYSFRELGSLSYIPITDDMIYTQNDNQVLRYNCYVDTGVDLSQKTVMLVLGGYLHILDKRTFFRTSQSAFCIDFDNLPFLDRFFESKDVIDLSSLGLVTSTVNKDQVSIANLYSDAVLRKYLQLSQTFFVVLDNEDIFVDTEYVRPSPYPGVYTAYTPPIYPLVVGAGRHETYWYREEKPFWSLNLKKTLRGKMIYDTDNIRLAASVSNNEVTAIKRRNSDAVFLKVGTDLLTA